MKVLLVDDDVDLLDVTAHALRREGFVTVVASDGRQALRSWKAEKPDVVVLDIGLPQLNGFEVCRRIRQAGNTPVIFLTGLTADDQVVLGYQLGADDYVTKPFSPRQLAARIRAVRRRSVQSRSKEAGEAGGLEPPPEVRAGRLVLDTEAHDARLGDHTAHLTPIEFRLLCQLALNAGRVVSAPRLVEYAWQYQELGTEVALLKTHITHLRRKLGLGRGAAGEIRAIPGVGYQLRLVPDAPPTAPGGAISSAP